MGSFREKDVLLWNFSDSSATSSGGQCYFNAGETMREIVTVLFDYFETLDVFGPVEIPGRLKEHFNIQLCSMEGGIVTSSQNVKVVTQSLAEVNASPYILFIPGGVGTRELIKDDIFIGKLKSLSRNAEYILTVCTGSILFSKTGLLNGKKATSNKRVFSWAEKESPEVIWIRKARWMKDGNLYTSSGVSAGMDMTLGFVADILGYDIAKQQSIEIEYDWKEDAAWDPFSEIYS
jgi:putative intracellular protease/amidase